MAELTTRQVAAVTVAVPLKPLAKLTEFFAPVADAKKPKPWMVTVVRLAARLVVVVVIAVLTADAGTHGTKSCLATKPPAAVDDP